MKKKTLLLLSFLVVLNLSSQSCCDQVRMQLMYKITQLENKLNLLENKVDSLSMICDETPIYQTIRKPFLPEQDEESLFLYDRLPQGCNGSKAIILMDDVTLYVMMTPQDGWRIYGWTYGGLSYCPEN